MQSQLDNYLSEIAIRLRSLPEGQRESDLTELRQHLESMVAAYKELNCTDDEAVVRAVQQFGPSRLVARKLLLSSRSNNAQRVSNRLCFAGWSLFLISLSLPVIKVFGSTILGFVCAAFMFSPSLPTTNPWGLFYYHGLGLANLLLFASPVLFTVLKQKRQSWFLSILLCVSTASILPLLNSDNWQIGFYAWWASFGLVTAGSLVRTLSFYKRSNRSRVPKPV